MKKWKKIVLGIVILFTGAAAYGFYMYYKKPADIRKETAQFELSAIQLVKDFYDNEDTANKKYLDKIIAVKGIVTDIKIDTSGQATVFLDGDDPLSSVTCSFYNDEAVSAKALQKGSTAVIKGKCTGKLMDVVLNKCSVVK